MAPRVIVDRDACLSSARCVARSGGHLVLDDDELAVVDPSVPVPDAATLTRLVADCPAGAITVVDEGDAP